MRCRLSMRCELIFSLCSPFFHAADRAKTAAAFVPVFRVACRFPAPIAEWQTQSPEPGKTAVNGLKKLYLQRNGYKRKHNSGEVLPICNKIRKNRNAIGFSRSHRWLKTHSYARFSRHIQTQIAVKYALAAQPASPQFRAGPPCCWAASAPLRAQSPDRRAALCSWKDWRAIATATRQNRA